MESSNVHPQVLLNISSQLLSANQHQRQHPIQLGILLGTYNSKINQIDILDSFEAYYKQGAQLDSEEIEFLKERMELRLRGDKWNLFKHLDIVGWYITDPNLGKYIGIHKQINMLVNDQTSDSQTSFFKYLLCFNCSIPQYKLYEINDETQNFTECQTICEPQTEEMISITSALQQDTNKDQQFQARVNQSNGTLQFMEGLLLKIYSALNRQEVANDPILLRTINEMLISYPKLTKQTLEPEYCRLHLVAYYCVLLKLKHNHQQSIQMHVQ